MDQYPYDASGGLQNGLLPTWTLEGGRDSMLKRLNDAALRARPRTGCGPHPPTRRGSLSRQDPDRIAHGMSSLPARLADVARLHGKTASPRTPQAAMWIAEQGDCEKVLHNNMSEVDIERILKHPATMIASDGEIPAGLGDANAGPTHPRSYGTFVRVLGVYVRERKLLGLEEAVHKMSAMPAQRLGLRDRGLIRADMKADLVVFDPARVRDASTFENPHQYAEGVLLVIVNGQIVFENNAMTSAAGRCKMGRRSNRP
jgi:dihydroorotase/N-acyl-D-amino-acid deacylase